MNEHKNLLAVLGEWWAQHHAEMRGAVPSERPVHWRRLMGWMAPRGGTL